MAIVSGCLTASCSLPAVLAQESVSATNAQPIAGDLTQLIAAAMPRIAKVYGAGAGMVEGYSSGTIISADGLIVTSQGVYLDGPRVRVGLADGTMHEAAVVRRDRRLQLALLRIGAETPDCFDLSAEPEVRQGDWVISLSNAFRVADGAEPVSAWLGPVALSTSMDARRSERVISYAGRMLLIDSITSNPGAAGGAVVTLDGHLAGVIGRIIDSTETNTRLNYAVPVDLVRAFVEGRLEDSVAVETAAGTPGWLGIRLFGQGGRAAPPYVDAVEPGSPAARAGIRPDDMIVSVGGRTTGTVRECGPVLESLRAGEEIVIVVKRGKELLRFSLVPETLPQGDGR